MPPMNQMQSQPGMNGDQAKALFDQGVSAQAYQVLLNKLPALAGSVVTFKIIDSDPEAGSGVGAFVVQRGTQILYVPVVMCDSKIKPLDLLFFKEANMFLPLTKDWLAQLEKLSVSSMGQGVRQPATLSTDLDIRNTVIPPTTGRYSYASEQRAVDEADSFIKAARDQSVTGDLSFLEFISKAPGHVKKAAAKVFETHPEFLKQAVHFYGQTALLASLKLADYGGKLSPSGGLYVADKETGTDVFKKTFGSASPMAYGELTRRGFVAKDDRQKHNKAIRIQPYKHLTQPSLPGAYKLFTTDGKPVVALIVSNPIDLFNPESQKVQPRNIRERKIGDTLPGVSQLHAPHHAERYVGVTEDGVLLDATHLMGEPVAMSELSESKVFKTVLGTGEMTSPRKGSTGFFLKRDGDGFVATKPLTIESISTSGGTRRIEVSGPGGTKTLVTEADSPTGRLMVTHHHITMLPNSFMWIPTKDAASDYDYLCNPMDILNWVTKGMMKEGAELVKVSFNTSGFTFGDTPREAFGFVPALRKLAQESGVTVDDAEAALKIAEMEGRCEFWKVSEEKLEKVAALLKVAEGDPRSGGKKQEQTADPAQQAMDQVQMAQMAQAQGPQPVDMAVAEQMQNLQAQQLSIQQQMQMLQQVQMRANMIAGTGGAQGNPAAAAAAMGGPMDPSMMGAGAPVQGMPGGQPQQQQMGQPGQPQQQQMGQPQPGMGDPSQQQQPPSAMMTSDDGSVDTLASQINPQFAEQAGQLQDKGVFDASALAQMAQAPGLKDMVAAYVPNLEKSLDNLGRVLLSLWIDEAQIKEELGNETFIALEDNLRNTLKGLGDLILKVNQNSLILSGQSHGQGQGA